MTEENLTKQEKRELAKEQKQNQRSSQERANKLKTLSYVLAVLVVIVGGIWYLSTSSPTPSSNLTEKFNEYAGELGLNQEQFTKDLNEKTYESRVTSAIASGNARGINSTPTFYINDEKIENPQGYEPFAELVRQALSENEGNAPIELSESDWVKGKENASVTVIEYADFQCPACGLYNDVMNQLYEEFSGEVRFVYRHFPLVTIHPNAYPASLAVEAAGAQGKFWEMHDLLFEKQQEWSRL